MDTTDPNSLVKFTDVETAKLILSGSCLRWSAPYLFHDPFELDHHSDLNFDLPQLLNACVKEARDMLFAKTNPVGSTSLIRTIQRWRSTNRFDKEEEAQEVLKELFKTMVIQHQPRLQQLMAEWRRYTRTLRVLCLSNSYDDPLLWSRYGDCHRGVALRFGCGVDSSLENPMEVRYGEHRPHITSLEEQRRIVLNNEKFPKQFDFKDKLLQKSKHLRHEKEWRLFTNIGQDNIADETVTSAWYTDIDFRPQEMRAIYFGANIDPAEKSELFELVEKKYTRAKILQAIPQPNNFALDFERLNG